MHVQLKSVTDQLNTVQGLVVPQFGDLRAWLAQAGAAKRAENKYKMVCGMNCLHCFEM